MTTVCTHTSCGMCTVNGKRRNTRQMFEASEAPEAPTEATEAAKATEATEAATASQGGRTKGAVVIQRDDSVIHALQSPDGSMSVTRESLAEHPEALMVWDFAVTQWCAAQRVVAASDQTVSAIQKLCKRLTTATRAVEQVEKQPSDNASHAPLTRPFELRAGGNGHLNYGPERWQRKKIGRKAIAKRLAEAYTIELVMDLHDTNGAPYEAGDKSNATYCGAFPHALIRHKVGSHKGKDVFVCSGCMEVVLTIRLVCKEESPVTERHVLEELKGALTDEELAQGWGEFEDSMRFFVELQFANDTDLDSPQNWVCSDVSNLEMNAFKKTPLGQVLLSPPEHVPYTKGRQEMRMIEGKAETQFGFNANVTSNNLNGEKSKSMFRFAIRCLNPYLNSMASFNVASPPFIIKRSLHNQLASNERWVKNDSGVLTKVPPDSVPRSAPSRPGAPAKRGGGGE